MSTVEKPTPKVSPGVVSFKTLMGKLLTCIQKHEVRPLYYLAEKKLTKFIKHLMYNSTL